MDRAAAVQDIRTVIAQLRNQGLSDQAEIIEQRLDVLASPPPTANSVMTTGAAAQELGIRSVNTIKRWVHEGLLEGFQRGGRILVSRQSVENMKTQKPLARQRTFERSFDEAFEPFGTDDLSGDLELAATWQGRKPWANVGSTAD